LVKFRTDQCSEWNRKMMKTLVVILCLTIGLNYAMWVSKLRGR